MTMPRLDELARSARLDLARAADQRAPSRPELEVLRRRGTLRRTASLVVITLLVAVGAAALFRFVAVGEVTVPFIGDTPSTPSAVDEGDDGRASVPPARSFGPVTLEFDSGGPEPHRLILTGTADGEVCRTLVAGSSASMMGEDAETCGDRISAGALSGARATWVSSGRRGAVSCEIGMVREDVASVALHFPDGRMEAATVKPAPEIGDAHYATCWQGDHGLSTLVVFGQDGRELGRSDYIDP